MFGSKVRPISIKARRESGDLPDRIVDVHFKDQMRDPVSGIRGAYEKMGRPFDDGHAHRIRDYLENKPRGKFGKHFYSFHDLGLDLEREVAMGPVGSGGVHGTSIPRRSGPSARGGPSLQSRHVGREAGSTAAHHLDRWGNRGSGGGDQPGCLAPGRTGQTRRGPGHDVVQLE